MIAVHVRGENCAYAAKVGAAANQQVDQRRAAVDKIRGSADFDHGTGAVALG